MKQKEYTCPRCKGRGLVTAQDGKLIDCPDCDGAGTWMDDDAGDWHNVNDSDDSLALELANLGM